MTKTDKNNQHKFGTFAGVFIPSILTIFGPIMFMRFGYVIGNVGMYDTLLILSIAQAITLSTGFSLAAISTNTPVLEGGAYYLISRSLGAGFGGAIGLTLFLAQALSVPFYIIGFTEAFLGTFPSIHFLYLIIALVTGIVLFILAWSGANWAVKAQVGIFVVLILAIAFFLIGAGLKVNSEAITQNTIGIKEAKFFTMFAIFFPAVTGIMAGVNMSGDLKNPGHSLAKGTFWAIIFATIIYGIEIFICGSAFSKEALISQPYTTLVNNAFLGFGFLVVIGVFAATISSAIGSFLGAPRVLRALSRDMILPGLQLFTKEKNVKNEPRKALVLTLIITISVLLWAGVQAGKKSGADPLNIIAQVVSMFFLYTYGMINLAAFVESFGDNPSFRPRFKYFHWSIALFGALSSIAVSFLVDYKASIIALIFLTILFVIARKRELTQEFGDARRGFIYSRIRNNLIRLNSMPFNPKNWRPTIAVLVGNINSSSSRLPMLKFASKFECGKGIISLVEFINGEFNQLKDIRAGEEERLKRFLKENDFQAVFPEVIVAENFDIGLSNFLQTHSIGAIKPNIIMMGCPKDNARYEPFIKHLQMIAYLEKSFIIYKEPVEYTAANTEYPGGKHIDIWWRGHQNGSLMLILAHLLQGNPLWKDCVIRIIRIVDKEPGIKAAKSDLNKMINASRIEAEAKVIVSENFNEILQITSKNSAAVFMGTIIPEIKESSSFFDRINTQLINMPPVFLIYSYGDADLLA